MPVYGEFKIPKAILDAKLRSSGMLAVSEKIWGPIDLSLENNRCRLDMKSCEKFMTFNIKEICKKMNDPLPLYSNVFKYIEPPLKCPVEPGNYTVKPMELDLSVMALMPFDGYVYITSAKVSSTVNGGKTKKIAWCVIAETKIVKIRVKS